MASILLAALRGTGAVTSVEPLVRTLLQRGHSVTVLSDPGAERRVRALGAGFAAVDDPRLPSLGQRPASRLERLRRLRPNMRATFLDTLPAQWAAVQRVLGEQPVDVVIADLMFFGAVVLGAVPREERPALVVLGMVPPPAEDPDVAPYGTGIEPMPGWLGRVRNVLLARAAAAAVTGVLDEELRQLVQRCTGYSYPGSIWNLAERADVWAQASVPRFDYPRAAPPSNLRWIGPLAAVEDLRTPDWTGLDDEAPIAVVHTDGRRPVDRVVLPAIDALRHDGCTIVVCGATRAETAAASAGPLPRSIMFERGVPWSRLVPGRGLFITSGDYVHVQHALSRGVPVVVTGESEPQVETKARVRWAGVGVDVHEERPTPAMLAEAIAKVRADERIALSVARIAAQMDRTDAERSLADLVDALTSETPEGAAVHWDDDALGVWSGPTSG